MNTNLNRLQHQGIVEIIEELKGKIWQKRFDSLQECYYYLSPRLFSLLPGKDVDAWLSRIVLLTYDQLLIDCFDAAISLSDYRARIESLKWHTPFFEDYYKYNRVEFKVEPLTVDPIISPTTRLESPFDFSSTPSYTPSPQQIPRTPTIDSPRLAHQGSYSLYNPSEPLVYEPQKYEPETDIKALPPAIDV